MFFRHEQAVVNEIRRKGQEMSAQTSLVLSLRRAERRLHVAVLVLTFVLCLLLGTVAVEAAQAKPHNRRCPMTISSEISFPSEASAAALGFPVLGSTPLEKVGPMHSIPGAAPYITRVRQITRMNIQYATFIYATGGKVGTPDWSTTFPIRFELFRSGQLVYSTAIDQTTVEANSNGALGGGRNSGVGTIMEDFVNPILIYSGQSLEWRFTAFYRPPTTEPPTKDGGVLFSPAATIVGEELRPAPSVLFYTEDVRGR